MYAVVSILTIAWGSVAFVWTALPKTVNVIGMSCVAMKVDYRKMDIEAMSGQFFFLRKSEFEGFQDLVTQLWRLLWPSALRHRTHLELPSTPRHILKLWKISKGLPETVVHLNWNNHADYSLAFGYLHSVYPEVFHCFRFDAVAVRFIFFCFVFFLFARPTKGTKHAAEQRISWKQKFCTQTNLIICRPD